MTWSPRLTSVWRCARWLHRYESSWAGQVCLHLQHRGRMAGRSAMEPRRSLRPHLGRWTPILHLVEECSRRAGRWGLHRLPYLQPPLSTASSSGFSPPAPSAASPLEENRSASYRHTQQPERFIFVWPTHWVCSPPPSSSLWASRSISWLGPPRSSAQSRHKPARLWCTPTQSERRSSGWTGRSRKSPNGTLCRTIHSQCDSFEH